MKHLFLLLTTVICVNVLFGQTSPNNEQPSAVSRGVSPIPPGETAGTSLNPLMAEQYYLATHNNDSTGLSAFLENEHLRRNQRSHQQGFGQIPFQFPSTAPDLFADRIVFRTADGGGGVQVDNPTVGQNLYETFYFQNQGDVDASGPVRLEIYRDGSLVGFYNGSFTYPAHSYWFLTASVWTATGGSHTLQGDLDVTGIISESDESNNTISSVVPNTPPTISLISDTTTLENTQTGALSFTVGDAETSPPSLTVSASYSSNTSLVPYSSFSFGGSGINRTVTITPTISQVGYSYVGITVSDGALSASTYFYLSVIATHPRITSVNPMTGPIGTSVNLVGVGFSSDPDSNIVYFGGTIAAVTSSSYSSAIVTVPAGATYAPITATRNNLTGYSPKPFTVTFPSSQTIDDTSFATHVDFTSGTGPEFLTTGDFDGDGKLDMAAVSTGSNALSVFRNTSTSGSITGSSFAAKIDLTTALTPTGITVGDIDGDGKLDLVNANYSSTTISVFRNTGSSGTISFDTKVDFGTASSPFGIAMGDLDGDGKPEVVAANEGGASVSVLRNTSTVGSVSFAAKADFTAGTSSVNVAIGDIDGDGKRDLIVTNQTSNTISVLRNTSTAGSISFAPKVDQNVGSAPNSAVLCDLDGDGKLDAAVANINSHTLSVARNISTPGTIEWSSWATYATGTNPRGLGVGDLDGDGKPDLAVANYTSSTASVFKNTSIPGTISLATKVDFGTGVNPKGFAIADLDGDGKSDLLAGNNTANSVSVLRNTVSQPGAFSISPDSLPFGLVAVNSNKLDSVTVTNTGLNQLIISSAYSDNYEFYVTPTSATIPGGGSGKFYVTFSPYDSEGITANIIFAHNGTTSPDSLEVSGTGGLPSMTVLPESLSVTLTEGDSATTDIALGNTGAVILSFSVGTQTNSPAQAIAFGPSMTPANLHFTELRDSVNRGKLAQEELQTFQLQTLNPFGGTTNKSGPDLEVNSILFSDDMESGTNGWTSGAITGSDLWHQVTTNYASSNHSWWCGIDAQGNYDNGQRINCFVMTPTINLSTTTSAVLHFKENYQTESGWDHCIVQITTDDGVSWQTIRGGNSGTSGGWVSRSISLGSYIGYSVRIRFLFDTVDAVAQAYAGWFIDDVTITTSWLAVTPISGTVSVGGSQALDILLNSSNLLPGVYDGSIAISSNDPSNNPKLVPVHLLVQTPPVFSVAPSSINWGYMSTATKTDSITVTNTGQATLNISSAASSDPQFEVNPTSASISGGGSQTFFVTLTADGAGEKSSNITFTHNAAGSPSTVAVTATVLPAVTSITPGLGTVGGVLSVSGANFSTTASNNTVYFGGVRGTVTAASATSLKVITASSESSLTVTVPVGATYAPISVTTGGLTAYSPTPFLPTFVGTGIIDGSSFATHVDFTSGTGPEFLTTGDFDGDGKLDMAAVSTGSNALSVFRNTSTSGSITGSSFAAKIDLTTALTPTGITVGDIDGDGKLDLVNANYSSTTISVFRNTGSSGTISFDTKVDFGTASSPFGIAMGDLDGDGKPEVVAANEGGASVSVLRNTSTVGSVSFAAKADFTAGTSSVNVAIGDIDGDGKPDLIVTNQTSNTISVLRNTSTTGSISFAPKVDQNVGSAPNGVAICDLDGDGKPDAVVANINSHTLSVARNISTPGAIEWESWVTYTTGTNPRDLDVGDLDGDGKPDLAVANYSSSTSSVFKNTSTPGTISLATKVDFGTGVNPKGFTIGDMDGDGKPDLLAGNNTANSVSVLRNTVPYIYSITASSGPNGSITPSGSVIILQGFDTTFTFTPDAGFGVDSVFVDGGYVGNDTIYTFTNVAASHTVHVVFAPNAPSFSVAPSSLSFGDVFVGASKTDSITITNNGGVPLIISSISSNHPEFSGPGSSSFGSALLFDGLGDYVTMSMAGLPLGSAARTVEARFKTAAGVALGEILSYGSPAGGEAFTVGVFNGEIFVSSFGSPQYFAGTGYNDGIFHHLAVVFDGSTSTIYVDGTLIDSQAFTNNASSGLAYIGARVDPFEEFFEGTIDEVRVWNFARSQVQIQGTMNSELTGSESGLVGYWPLNEGAGTTTADASPGTNTGTLTNGPAWTGGALSIPPGSSTKVAVTFSPISVGVKSGTLSLVHNASGSPGSVTLDGNGYGLPDASAGWNLLSVPVAAPDFRKIIVYPTAASDAFRFVGSLGYQQRDTLANGEGYWIKFTSGQPLTMMGSAILSDTFAVVAGWNLVGSVSQLVPAASITAIGTSILTSFYKYAGAYVNADTLVPGLGYWVKVLQTGSLVLGTPSFLSLASNDAAADDETENDAHLTVTDALGRRQTLIIRMTNGNRTPSDRFELPPFPPEGAFDVRFASQRAVELVDPDDPAELPVSISSPAYPLTLSWERSAEGLRLRVDSRELAMSADGTVRLESPVSRVSIVVGVNSELPTRFSLEQNYPNPFNPSTRINYSLPKDAWVTLKVFNVLGQQVKILVDEIQKAGYKEVEFDASALASGTYVYGLQAGDFYATRKMLIVK